ncbi:TetR/AcrR family transcriptional regulator [Thetidibacter halocola]|uniref:TetR family transcriptional regulator n=1 Tax=Thetidibacter halocola TaxID=2827239 RepID=A0A8J8B854_9RHOB|nr:TetR/AcrR family transcriptional regulator [Thetidibacter halocola]MBS0125836.1 TetR family transcriptional regulator [Thetidibacter halocola]
MPRGLAHDHSEKRDALRDGSAQYFAAHGFDRASMAGAARACGVSKALLYHYYDSKEALLHDILDSHYQDVVTRAEAAAPDGLRALIAALLEAFEHADAEHKLQLESLNTLPDALRAPILEKQRHLVRLMSGALQIQRPDLRGDRLRAATMTVFGILNWVYQWHRPGKGLSRAEFAALAADFAEGGLKNL